MGVEAARLLLARFDEPEAPRQRRVLDTELVPRGSTRRLGEA
jgi:DNA-binding LacI/PurR family transcriptional regulator